MPGTALQLEGERLGMLTVLKRCGTRIYSSSKKALWLCLCDCGKTIETTSSCLKRKVRPTRSCGCLQIQKTKVANTTHGMKRLPEYRVWSGMKNRCLNIKSKDYERYGALGITVCEEWLEFTNFFADMGRRPSTKHSLERINNSNNYCLENCVWADSFTQSNNRFSNHFISFNNQTLSLSQWERELLLPKGILSKRISKGWGHTRALTTPVNKQFSNKRFA